MTHHLDTVDSTLLAKANEFLTIVTRTHSHNCQCLLCDARVLTDVQETSSYRINNVTIEEDPE